MRSNAKDLRGRQFGRLTAIRRDPESPKKYAKWICNCSCGRTISVYQQSLLKPEKGQQSCGCHYSIGDRMRKHGAYESAEYGVWEAMRQRCNNPNAAKFHNHGGRGIRVCERWNDFRNFLADVGPRPTDGRWTIERIDNDGDYEPGNVKWATYAEQSANRRITIFIEHNGLRLTMRQWSERLGIPVERIAERNKRKLPVERVLHQGLLPNLNYRKNQIANVV